MGHISQRDRDLFENFFVLELANNHWGKLERGLKIIREHAAIVRYNNVKAAIKLPESWASAEVEFEQLLRKRLYRGTVTLTVRMKIPDEQAAYRVNVAALTSYIAGEVKRWTAFVDEKGLKK